MPALKEVSETVATLVAARALCPLRDARQIRHALVAAAVVDEEAVDHQSQVKAIPKNKHKNIETVNSRINGLFCVFIFVFAPPNKGLKEHKNFRRHSKWHESFCRQFLGSRAT